MSISVHRPTTRILGTLALGAVIPLVLVSCGGSKPTPAASTPVTPTPVATASPSLATDTPTVTDTPSPTPTVVAANQPFGPGCPRLPDTGAGSLTDLATTPVATAASKVPILSRLTGAIKVAGLTSRLNAAQDITVFAPADAAFTGSGRADVASLLTNPKKLASVLSLHVVTQRLGKADLAGTHKTLNGQSITITGSGENFKVNGQAKIICGNIQTANATIYVIDRLLSPK